jgi:hypothetical protein
MDGNVSRYVCHDHWVLGNFSGPIEGGIVPEVCQRLRDLNGVLNPCQIAAVPYIEGLEVLAQKERHEIEVLKHCLVELVARFSPAIPAQDQRLDKARQGVVAGGGYGLSGARHQKIRRKERSHLAGKAQRPPTRDPSTR